MYSVFIKVFHDVLGFLVRRLVPVVVVAAVVCHDLDALSNQPIEALLQCRVHVGNCCRKSFRVEVVAVHRHFPVFGKAVLSALSNFVVHNLEF